MWNFLSAVISALLLAVSFAPVTLAAEAAPEDTVTYGIHPWDVRPRRVAVYTDKLGPVGEFSDWYFYSHPDRSKTYALHPYFRARYYAPPIDTDQVRYSMTQQSHSVRYAVENAYVPKLAETARCDNYSFGRPNYRVPPYDYQCTE
jgi:hypothetical protein